MPGFGKLDWSHWLYGLFWALIGGGASSVSAGVANVIVDPAQFNPSHPLKLLETMAVTFIVAGVVAGFGFLKQQPLPPVKT